MISHCHGNTWYYSLATTTIFSRCAKKGAEIKMSSILQSVRATAAKIVAAMIDWPLLEWHINDDETAKSRQIKAADKAKKKSLHFSEGH